MTKRSTILLLVVCSAIAVFTVRTLSQPRGPNQTVKLPDPKRWQNMTEEEKKKEHERMRAQQKLERERRRKEYEKRRKQRKLEFKRRPIESARERAERIARSKAEREQRYKEFQERVAKSKKEFLYEKSALGATDEQWKVIKAKLERVRQLRDQARSTVGVGLTSSSSSGTSSRDRASRNVPTWQWTKRWKDKAISKLTDSQKIANELINLVENRNTTPEQFRRKMDALRKARGEDAEIKRQLSEAQQELRELLTTRQEAALVLMQWL